MRKSLLITVLIVITGLLIYQRLQKQQVEKERIVGISADQLFSEFEGDEIAATKKFNGRELVVFGVVKSVNIEQNDERSITLKVHSQKFGVICRMDKSLGTEINFSTGDDVKVKGICKGMMMDVVLVNCIPETE